MKCRESELEIYYCLIKFSSKPKKKLMQQFHIVVLQRKADNCSKVRAARATLLFSRFTQLNF